MFGVSLGKEFETDLNPLGIEASSLMEGIKGISHIWNICEYYLSLSCDMKVGDNDPYMWNIESKSEKHINLYLFK